MIKKKLSFSSLGDKETPKTSHIPPETKIERIGNTELYHHDGFVEIHEPIEDSDLTSEEIHIGEDKKEDRKLNIEEERDLNLFLQKLGELEELEENEDESLLDTFDFGISNTSSLKPANQIDEEISFIPFANKTGPNRISNPSDIFSLNSSNKNENNIINTQNNREIKEDDNNGDFTPTPILKKEIKPKKEKKKVSFSEEVKAKEIPKTPFFNSAFTGVIVERSEESEEKQTNDEQSNSAPKRVSRFKAQRQSQ